MDRARRCHEEDVNRTTMPLAFGDMLYTLHLGLVREAIDKATATAA